SVSRSRFAHLDPRLRRPNGHRHHRRRPAVRHGEWRALVGSKRILKFQSPKVLAFVCKKSGRLRSKDMTRLRSPVIRPSNAGQAPTKEPHMRLRIWLAALLLAAGVLGSRTSTPVAQAHDSAPDQGTSSLDDQVDLAVTVYNSDIALVRDVRELQLPRGGFDLRFMDIAATVNPATVHFRSLTEPSRVSVLEQNYEYDLLEPEKLLRKYVGR